MKSFLALLGIAAGVIPAGFPAEPVIVKRTVLADRIEEIIFASPALGGELPFTVIIPVGASPRKPWPVLFLLHGAGNDNRTLLDRPPARELLVRQDFLIVMPHTRGWYVNSPIDPSKRWQDTVQELFRLVAREFPVRVDRAGWAIAGWSMGGFGAIYHAELQPERFGFAASMIGLLDFPREQGLPKGQSYPVPRKVFGNDPAAWEPFNPINRVDRLTQTSLSIVVAKDAFDFTMNENFLRTAASHGLKVSAHHLPGGHTDSTVNAALAIVLEEAGRFFGPPAALWAAR